ncbi:hypothetical protein B0H10DRAFT_2232196 [Mycena sp. CBHHK59/15]|nr:hypothetical protein B0H10DRAFT_2232196 [Mycena sp. CBHHK59/15]
MTPEHLIGMAQLSQWYKFGLNEGDYKHRATANVKVSNVGSSSTVLSMPSLLDLLNDNNIAPQDVNREALEKVIFDRPDPYDLDETDHIDAAILGVPRVQWSLTHWAVAEYVRLNSPALVELISPEKKDEGVPVVVETSQVTAAEAEKEEWDVDD